MCGRFALFATPVDVGDLFDAPPVEWPPRYNVAPTQPVLACRPSPAGARLTSWRAKVNAKSTGAGADAAA